MMLDDYLSNQKIAYKMITNSVKKNRISHAYLVESSNNMRSFGFALSFAKFLLCPLNRTNNKKCVKCTQCKRIDDGCFSELYILKSDGLQIKKEQIINLQEQFSKKSIESSFKICIIDEAEKLNASSSASLLKFLEEPEKNIIAILVTSNKNLLLNTILSRCQIISLAGNTDKEIDILDNITNMMSISKSDQAKFLEENNIENKIQAIKDFLYLLNTKGIHSLAYTSEKWYKFFNTKEEFILAFNIMILLLKEELQHGLNEKENSNLNKYNAKIIKMLDLAINFKDKIKYNLNLNLLLDKFIIDVGGIK
ncbi:MAG: AAA family ATPase [Clostridium sp.]|nr:AAA family ATPase [Clostridium sp.]MCM1443781.1 AAA family ATPase [Candidatus Amulumruptor caecigallinarius]